MSMLDMEKMVKAHQPHQPHQLILLALGLSFMCPLLPEVVYECGLSDLGQTSSSLLLDQLGDIYILHRRLLPGREGRPDRSGVSKGASNGGLGREGVGRGEAGPV